MPLMASLRTRSRKDGTVYYVVLYRDSGKQTSTSFEDLGTATSFQKLVDVVGRVKALASVAADPALSTITVKKWLAHYIDATTPRSWCRRRPDGRPVERDDPRPRPERGSCLSL